MPIKNANDGSLPGASPVVERFVATSIKVESLMARGLYWISALIALLMVGWVGLIINEAVRIGNWRDGLVYTPALLAVAGFVYFLGWGWRWLWSGRTDNLFGRKKYTAPGRLDGARQKIVTVLSFWVW
jgi:hypothetical protein